MRKFTFLMIFIWGLICFSLQTTVAFAYSMQLDEKRFISYTDSGKGTPLVLIHAFPTDKKLWSSQDGLSRYFRVITIDLWGFGESSPVDGKAISMTEYADEVSQLLDQLHIKKAIIGGESMGGYIALAFLQKYSDQVSGLILSDTQSIADSPEMKAKREATAIDVLEHGTTQLINSFIPKALSPTAPEEKVTFLKNILVMQTPTAIASALRGMALRDDTSNILANTTLPILIITGDQDILISPQQSQDMHALAKNSKLITIPHAGHLSSLEQPEEWNQAVINMFYNSKNSGIKMHYINNTASSFYTYVYEPETGRAVGPKVRKNGGTADEEFDASHTWLLVGGTYEGDDDFTCETDNKEVIIRPLKYTGDVITINYVGEGPPGTSCICSGSACELGE